MEISNGQENQTNMYTELYSLEEEKEDEDWKDQHGFAIGLPNLENGGENDPGRNTINSSERLYHRCQKHKNKEKTKNVDYLFFW